MVKKLLTTLIAMICIPIMVFCGCSKTKSDLDSINLKRYFADTVTCTTHGKTSSTTVSLKDLISEEPNTEIIGRYSEFSFSGEGVWLYKMYIDYIYFYVYTNIDSSSQMTLNITMTNLAKENDIENPETFTTNCSLIPQKEGSTLCEIKVGKVVATATGSKLTIDTLNTPEAFQDEFGEDNGLRWCIYDLKFFAESRPYSK